MTTTEPQTLPQTLLYGLLDGPETLQSIGKVMEFVSSSTFLMANYGTEYLEHSADGLHVLLQHLCALHETATARCESDARVAEQKIKHLAQFEQLVSLYQYRTKAEQAKRADATAEQKQAALMECPADWKAQLQALEEKLLGLAKS